MGANGVMHQGSRTSTYSPTAVAPYYGSYDFDGRFSRYDIDLMDRDPRVRIGFRALCAPVEAATFKVECDNPDCEEFITRTIKHFWMHDLSKAMAHVKFGTMAGEPVYQFDEYSGKNGTWHFDTLKDFHLDDVRALKDKSGNLWGIRVAGLREDQENALPWTSSGVKGSIDLQYPSAFWLANEPKFSSFYGYARYEGAWKPWKEKRGKHGAVDVRRLWMMKNSCRGAMMRYPEGTTETAPGVFTPNQDVAREIVEKYMAGFVMPLPSTRDDKGNYLWEWVEPKAGDDVSSILKYAPMLDVEILEGLEIWPEVLQAPGVGGGWSGRSLPYLQFLCAEDRIVAAVLSAFVRWVVRPLVYVNFGRQQRFHVEPISLLPKDTATQQMNQAGGAEGLIQQPESAAVPAPVPGVDTLQAPVSQPVQLAYMDMDGNVVKKADAAARTVSESVTTAVQNAILKFRQRMAEARSA